MWEFGITFRASISRLLCKQKLYCKVLCPQTWFPFRLVLLLSPVPAAVFSSKPHHGLPESACVLLVNLVRKQWGAFLGAVALQATCREETKLIKKCGCFLQWKITSLLGFHPWHQVLGSSSLNRLLSARRSPSQCPGTRERGRMSAQLPSFSGEPLGCSLVHERWPNCSPGEFSKSFPQLLIVLLLLWRKESHRILGSLMI